MAATATISAVFSSLFNARSAWPFSGSRQLPASGKKNMNSAGALLATPDFLVSQKAGSRLDPGKGQHF